MEKTTIKPVAKAAAVLQIGDAAIIEGFITTPFWKQLFYAPGKAFLSLIPRYFAFISALSSYCMVVFFRYKYSAFHTGFIATIMGMSFIVTFNSAIWLIVKPIFVIPAPFIALFTDTERLYQFLLINTKSTGLIIYCTIFLMVSLFHTLRMYFYNEDDIPAHGRGYSWIHLLLSRYISIQEFWVNIIIEPAIFILIGGLMYRQGDYYSAVFFWLSSVNEIWTQTKLRVSVLVKRKFERA